jgi:hypothetical protein
VQRNMLSALPGIDHGLEPTRSAGTLNHMTLLALFALLCPLLAQGARVVSCIREARAMARLYGHLADLPENKLAARGLRREDIPKPAARDVRRQRWSTRSAQRGPRVALISRFASWRAFCYSGGGSRVPPWSPVAQR